jgi:hypothetical protein
MANYKIIGGDQKQYGPVSAEDLRKWIAEGRLNAQSSAQLEGETEWKPLAAFPEFADMLAAKPPASGAPPTFAAPADWLERDYELDLGGCISRGWELLKDHFGLLFVGVLIYLLIEGALAGLGSIPFVGPLFSIANLFIAGPLMGGVFYIFIQAIRRQPAGVGDVFAGFHKAFVQLLLGYLVPALLAGLCLIPVLIVGFLSVFPALAHHQPPAKGMIFILLPVALICLIPLIYLQISWSFTLPLVIDKQMDFWPAMKASWKMVNKHWWLIFGLVVLVGLLNVAGLLVCCVGALFTVPIGIGALMYAYETIFGKETAQAG